MAAENKKRARPTPNASQRSKKKQKVETTAAAAKRLDLPSDQKKVSVGQDALPWNEVEMPEMFDDAEGFFGLEEIEGVEVVRDGNKVQFLSSKAIPIVEHDGDEFEGFDDDDAISKEPVVLSEKQVKAREKRERKRREKKELVKAEMEAKKLKRAAKESGVIVEEPGLVNIAQPVKEKKLADKKKSAEDKKKLVEEKKKSAKEKKESAKEKKESAKEKKESAKEKKESAKEKKELAVEKKSGAEKTSTEPSLVEETKPIATNELLEAEDTPRDENNNEDDVEADDDEDEPLQFNVFSALENDTNAEEVDVSAWDPLDLSSAVLSQLSKMGFGSPTTIQAEAIPVILAGHDCIGKASTGSGKTLAFGIPLVESWLESQPEEGREEKNDDAKLPHALILSPTRELAHQLADHITALCKGLDNAPYIVKVTGGLSVQKQQRQLALADIVIATPGRFWEVMSTSVELTKKFKAIKFLVIDEADRLLSEGHFKEVAEILGSLDRQVDAGEDDEIIPDRQTLVFSATFHKGLQQKLAGKGKGALADKDGSMEYLLKRLNFKEEKPKFIDTNQNTAMASGLKEGLVECAGTEKDLYLYSLLLYHPGQKTIIFTNSIHSVRRITPLLANLNLPAYSLHSQMAQQARMRSIERFADPKYPTSILVATDIAARGLDISGINLVVHYHLPRTADMYIHRSGRTARGSATGSSILICEASEVVAMRRLVAKVHAANAVAGGGNKAKYYMRSLDIDRKVVQRLKPRVTLAKKIADSAIAKEKKGHDDEWIRNAAEELGMDYDSDEFEAEGGGRKGRGTGRRTNEKEARAMSKGEVASLRGQLSELLSQRVNVGTSERYLTSGTVNIDELLRGVQGEFLGQVDGIGMD